jgi:hypothetical protein
LRNLTVSPSSSLAASRPRRQVKPTSFSLTTRIEGSSQSLIPCARSHAPQARGDARPLLRKMTMKTKTTSSHQSTETRRVGTSTTVWSPCLHTRCSSARRSRAHSKDHDPQSL